MQRKLLLQFRLPAGAHRVEQSRPRSERRRVAAVASSRSVGSRSSISSLAAAVWYPGGGDYDFALVTED